LTTSQRGETVSRDTLVKEAILLLTSSKSQSSCSKSLKEPSHVLKEPSHLANASKSQCRSSPRQPHGVCGWSSNPSRALIPCLSLSFPVSRSHSLSLALISCLSLSFPVSRSHSLSLALIPCLSLSFPVSRSRLLLLARARQQMSEMWQLVD